MAHYHTLIVLVENTAGVLARVSGLFARRGFNIESLTVAPTENSALSRFTIVVDAEAVSMDQVKKQLDKLINVVTIRELLPAESVEQEFMMVRVSAGATQQEEIKKFIEKYDVKILGSDSTSLILSMTGIPDEVERLENFLQEYGILDIQRTGKIAISNIQQSS